MAAPTGFEPVPRTVTGWYCDHSTMEPYFSKPICQRPFSFEVPIGTDPITHVYKTRIFPVKLRDH